MGILCDRFDVTNIILLSSVASATSVLLFWGLCPHGSGGIGNVISGPVSSALMQNQVGDVGGFSTSYGGLILFTGLTAVLAGYNGVWKGFSRLLSIF